MTKNPGMLVDLQQLLSRTKRSGGPLFAVYEAISNSLQAATHRDVRPEVEVRLVLQQLVDAPDSSEVASVRVIDNGIGFTDANMASFRTLYTAHKALEGGKGVGRLQWLLRFDHVEIDSVFSADDGSLCRRQFSFRARSNPIEPPEPPPNPIDGKDVEVRTEVHLRGLDPRLRSSFQRRPRTVARHIAEHFLPMFLTIKPEDWPRISVGVDGEDEVVEVGDIFREELQDGAKSISVSIGTDPLRVTHLWLSEYEFSAHCAVLCANARAVENTRFESPLLRELESDRPGRSRLVAFVTGGLLDQHCNDARDVITLPRTPDSLDLDTPSKARILAEVERALEGEFKARVEEIAAKNVEANRRFAEEVYPPTHVVLVRRPDLARNLSSGLSNDERFGAIVRAEADLRCEAARQAAKLVNETDAVALFEGLHKVIEEASASLTQWVAMRRWVLTLFERHLSARDDGKLSPEATVHELFFPRYRDSTVTWPEPTISKDGTEVGSNLWLIDERLSFHRYVSSEPTLSGEDTGRGDVVVVFGRSSGLPSQRTFDEFAVIEFKSPRGTSSKDDPVRQVNEYIRRIQEGQFVDDQKRKITASPSARFFGYVIETLDERRREELRDDQFRPTAFGSMFRPDQRGDRSIEVWDWQSVLEDAQRRHHSLFSQAGVPFVE